MKYNEPEERKMKILKIVLKVLLAVVLWIIEYFIIFGVGALPFGGKPLYQVSLLLFWIAFIIFIALAVLIWRLLFKRKKNE